MVGCAILNTNIYWPVGHKCQFCTFVDCSNYITLQQLVALRWLYEMLIWDVCVSGVIKIQMKSVCFLFVSVMCLLEKRLDSLLGGRLGWLVGGGWYQIEPAGRGLNWTLGPSWGSLVMVDNFQRYGYAGYSYWDPKDDFSHHDAFANQFILTPHYD